MTRVLVSGATGFIGSAIARQCQAVGLATRSTGRSKRHSGWLPDYVQADLLDGTSLHGLLEGVDRVIHAAGVAHQFSRARSNSSVFATTNMEATTKLVRAAIAVGVHHFILISSVSVYGPNTTAKGDETTPCYPEGPYAWSKYLAEQHAIELASQAGMNLTILRLATVYGEEDPGNITRLLRAIDRGRFIWVGSGFNRKSLIHRNDVARACAAVLLESPEGINVYNLSAPPCTMREIAEGLAAALERRLPSWYVPAAPVVGLTTVAACLTQGRGPFGTLDATVKKWLADDVYEASKFKQAFRFQTQVALADGLRAQVAWYRSI